MLQQLEDEGLIEFERVGLKGFIKAWQQVIENGTPAQQEAATAALDDARKAMYRILAGDDV